MKATWTRGTMACAVLTFSLACGGEKAAPAPPATTAPASTAVAPATAAPPATTLAPGAIGVAECDEYVTKYEACLRDHVPPSQKEAMQSAFDQAREGWKQGAVNAESRPALGRACKQAMDVAKLTTTALGCQW